jgi:hypothetical protein
MNILETANVFAPNPIYYPQEFQSVGDRIGPKIPAISLIASRPRNTKSFGSPLSECHAKLCRLIPESAGVKVFCAQDMFFDNSVIVRSKALWKSSKVCEEVKRSAKETGPERLKTVESKIRFYGLCSMELKQAIWAFEAIRASKSCFAVLDDALNIQKPEAADHYYSVAFPDLKDVAIRWPRLIEQLAHGSCQIIRVTGTHDDRDVAIDVFNFGK